jgi:hypothetical protein
MAMVAVLPGSLPIGAELATTSMTAITDGADDELTPRPSTAPAEYERRLQVHVPPLELPRFIPEELEGV